MRGKRGLVGSVKTPADLLTGKARKEYEGTSEVTTSSIYDHIMPFQEFKQLPKAKRMVTLYEYRKRFKTSEIARAWETSVTNVHYHFRALGVENPEKRAQIDSAAGKPSEAKTVDKRESSAPKADHGSTEAASPSPPLGDNRCDVRLCGRYRGAELARKLQGIALMALEDGQYELDLHFTEL